MRGIDVGVLLLAIPLAGCGGQSVVTSGVVPDAGAGADPDAGAGTDAGTSSFPTGTWTSCAQGVHNFDGNTFLNSTGFQTGATLAIARSGPTLTATYVDQNGTTSTLDFAATSSTSATLAGDAQVGSPADLLCVKGPGNESFHPADFGATAGALTVDAGTLFLSLDGTLHGDAGTCGEASTASAMWVACENGPAPQASDTGVPSPVPQLPHGSYACRSQLATYYQSGGTNQYVASGGDVDGTLTLTQTGAKVTADYAGDSSFVGPLRFNVTTATTANAEAGQSVTTPCEVPFGTGSPPPQASGTLSIGAASIAVDGATLFLAFTGAMAASSSCAGAQKVGSVVCSMQ